MRVYSGGNAVTKFAGRFPVCTWVSLIKLVAHVARRGPGFVTVCMAASCLPRPVNTRSWYDSPLPQPPPN